MNDIVRDAALLMDEVRPGWWREIDLSTLNIANGCHCVLGQTFGWTPGRIALLGSVEKWNECLDARPYLPWIGQAFLGSDKTEPWVHEILMRRAADAVLQDAAKAASVPVQPVSTPSPTLEPSVALRGAV